MDLNSFPSIELDQLEENDNFVIIISLMIL